MHEKFCFIVFLALLLTSLFAGALTSQRLRLGESVYGWDEDGAHSSAARAHATSDAVTLPRVDWWPMFHHDLTHTGYSTSTAPTTNETIWSYKTGGVIIHSLAVVGGVVFVGSNDNKVYALNASTGAEIWSYTTRGAVGSCPAVVDGVVFVNGYALNASTGTLVWSYTPGGLGGNSSPAVVGGIVYVGSVSDGKVYALNASTGALVWSYTTGNEVKSSPAVVGGVVFVGSNDNKVYALNASTGAEIWSYTTGGALFSSPSVAGDVVFVGSDDGKVYALNASTGALVWSYTTGGPVGSCPAVVYGVVFCSGDGKVYALNASTGALVWSYTTRGQGSPSSPAISGGVVFVGSGPGDNALYALNLSTGALVWRYETGGPVGSSPAVVGGVAYVGSNDYSVYAFSTPTVSVSPTSVALDLGQSLLFASDASGGVSPYTYQWYLDGAAVSGATSSTWTFTPSSIGSYTVYVSLTDYQSVRVKSNTAAIMVNYAPTVSILPSSVTLDVGQSQTFTASASGGSGALSYQWYLAGTALSGQTGMSYSFTPSSAGSPTIYCKVTDSASSPITAQSNTPSVTVNSALTAPSVSASLGTVDQGQTSSLSSSPVSTGTSPYSYQWLQKAPAASSYSGIAGATSTSYSFVTTTSTTTGTWLFELNVTDSASSPVTVTSTSVSVLVNLALSVSVSPTSWTMDVGQSETFTATPSGGTAPYSYQWYLAGSAVSGATGSTWVFTPSSAGQYSVYLNVTDSIGVRAKSKTVTITVTRVPTTVSCSALSPYEVSPSVVPYNVSVTVSGSIVPAVSGETVTLAYLKPDGAAFTRTATTSSDGSYSDLYKPDSVGPWSVTASWTGDITHEGASSPSVSFMVKVLTTISASISKTTITEGDEVTVSGSIQPTPGAVDVNLTYTKPDGTTLARTVTSTSAGAYTDTWKPTPKGSWSVTASWTGSETHEGNRSLSVSFTVKENPYLEQEIITLVAVGVVVAFAVSILLLRRRGSHVAFQSQY